MKKIIKKHKIKIITLFFISLLTAVFNLLFLMGIQRVLDSAIINENDDLTHYIIITLNLALFYFIFTYLNGYLIKIIEFRTDNDLRKKMYQNMTNNNLEFFDNEKDILVKITKEGEKLAEYESTGKILTVVDLIQLVGFLCVMGYYSLTITTFVIGLTFIGYLILDKAKKSYIKSMSADQSQYAKLYSKCNETINSILSIKSMFIEKFFKKRFNKEISKYTKTNRDISLKNARYFLVGVIVMTIMPIFVIILGAYLISVGDITIGILILLFNLTSSIQSPINSLSYNLMLRNQSKVSKGRVKNLLKTPPSNKFSKIEEINKISFNTEELTINKTIVNVSTNFEVNKGEIAIIKGETGSGKSTLLKSLIDYSKVTKGNIKIDDMNIDEINLSESNIAYLPQKAFVFEGTIKENIILDKEYNEKDVEEVIRICNLDDVIRRNTIDFSISEQNNLSGGEIQRISMARILLLKPKLLIFDESLNSLDKETADNVIKNIKKYVNDKKIIMLVISHGNLVDDIADKIITL